MLCGKYMPCPLNSRCSNGNHVPVASETVFLVPSLPLKQERVSLERNLEMQQELREVGGRIKVPENISHISYICQVNYTSTKIIDVPQIEYHLETHSHH